MANVKLGVVVTEIVGSVGGGTFRRSPNGLVLQKFNRGRAVSKLAQNRQLAKLSSFSQSWSSMAQTEKDKWVQMALVYSFPDKFGDLRKLTGRQLFLKLQGNFLVVNGSAIDILNSNSVRPSFEVDTISLNFHHPLILTLKNADNYGYCLLQIVKRTKGQTAINWARSQFIGFIDLSAGTTLDFTKAFFERYPYANDSEKYMFFLTSMNDYGFRTNAVSEINLSSHLPIPYYFKNTGITTNYFQSINRLLTAPFEFEVDIKVATGNTGVQIVSGLDSNLFISSTGRIGVYRPNQPALLSNPNVYPLDTRFKIRLNDDGVNTTLYVDNVLVAQVAQSGSFNFRNIQMLDFSTNETSLYGVSVNNKPYDFTSLIQNRIYDADNNYLTLIHSSPLSDIWLPV
jgi:hypothetical protein